MESHCEHLSTVRRFAASTVATAMAFGALCGCSTSSGLFRPGVSLEDKSPTDVELRTVSTDGHCPRREAKLVAEVSFPDGTRMTTRGAGGGKIRWDSFEVRTTAGGFDGEGTILLPDDPRNLPPGEIVRVRVRSKYQEGLEAETDIEPNYGCSYTADFSGSDGADGSDGMDGFDGQGGSSSFGYEGTDERSSRVGGGLGPSQADGEDGGDASDGMSGGDGTDVRVDIGAVSPSGEEDRLLQIEVSPLEDQRVERYLIDPDHGSLTIDASGGNGGGGGDGGDGGAAAEGGEPGEGGAPGSGGDGGDGGKIVVAVDEEAEPLLHAVTFQNDGGKPGRAGRPGKTGLTGPRPMFDVMHSDGRAGEDGPEPSVTVEAFDLPLW